MTKSIKTKEWKFGRDSFSKMIVYFKNGNIRTFYSIDWKYEYSKYRNRQLGYDRFRRLINDYSPLAKTILIYDLKSNELIGKFINGKRVDHSNK